jgi:hypothetical protein
MHTTPFRHPLASHAAGTILGWRRNGSPIYAIAGGSGEGAGESGSGGQSGSGEPGASGQAGTGSGGQGSGQDGQQSGQSGSASGEGQGDDGSEDVKSLPPWAQKALTDARAEAGKSRTTAKENAANQARQELAQEIGKALGLVKDDKPADPAELTRTITTQTGRIGELEGSNRALSIELAAYKAAGKHNASPAALLDSRSFLESVKGLDPSATDFATKLDDAIKAAVDANEQLRTGQALGRRGGGDFAGGPGTKERSTSLHAAIAAKLGG